MPNSHDAAPELQLQRRPCSAAWAAAFGAALALLASGAARAGESGPLGDLLQIVTTPRALLALAAEGGGDRREALERGERVLWTGSRGLVGVAVTDKRILAVTTRSAAWQTTRFRRGESAPHVTALGDRVALVVTDRRLLGFDGGSGNLVETSLGLREAFRDARVSANLAVVVTDRRALGLSPFVGGFFEVALRLGESLEGLEAVSDVATVTTSQRLLIFRATSGSWSERLLELR